MVTQEDKDDVKETSDGRDKNTTDDGGKNAVKDENVWLHQQELVTSEKKMTNVQNENDWLRRQHTDTDATANDDTGRDNIDWLMVV